LRKTLKENYAWAGNQLIHGKKCGQIWMTTEQYWKVGTERDKSDNLWILGGQIWIKWAKHVQAR
jgi:hypothetical protein